MTDPYGTVRAQIIDLQGNAIGGQPSNNDWRLVVDNEQLKFQHYDSTANSGNGAFLTRQSFGTGLTGINVVPQGTYSINGNLQVTDDLTVDGGSLFVDASTNRVGFGTLTPSQAVHIVGNTYVDGDLTVTGSASLSSSSVWTKTGGTNEVYYTGANVGVGTNNPEAQLDVNGTSKFTGNMTMKGHIIPDATNTYDLGSATKTFRHVYVGPGSLYVNGKQVVTDDSGTITISTDADQNLSLKTSGSGNVQINATGTGDLEIGAGGIVQVKKTLQMLDGQKITSSGSTTVVCGNNFQAEGSLRGTSLTLDGVNTVNSTELNVLDGVSPGTVAGSKAVVADANKDIAGLRNVTITGDLTVSGTTTTVNSTTVSVADSMFKYASANTGDALDMGWYGKYVDSGVTKYSGMFRDATDGKIRAFTGTQVEPSTTVDTTGTGYAKANVDVGDIEFTSGSMGGHIIPTVDSVYDIGSADYKVRHMFVSDNSLWVGDQHKISIKSGKMKFRKRKTTTVPAAVTTAGGNEAAALAHAGVGSLANMKLKHWKAYMRTLSGKANATISDIFREDDDDYDENVGADNWLDSGANLYRASGNVGIGTNNPGKTLHVNGHALFGNTVGSQGTANRNLNIIGPDAVMRVARNHASGYSPAIELLHLSSNGNTLNAYWDLYVTGDRFTIRDRVNERDTLSILESNGNVGIGNTAPGEKLEVSGGIKIGNASGSTAGTIRFQGGDFWGAKTNGNWTSLTQAGGSSVWSEVSTTASYAGSATITGTLKFNSTDGTEKIWLTSSGTNGSKIRTASGWTIDTYAGRGGATNEGVHRWFTSESSDYLERMRIAADGNVGVGTNNPIYKLEVNGLFGFTTGDADKIKLTFVEDGSKISHSSGWSVDMYAGQESGTTQSGQFRWLTNDSSAWAEQMRLINGKLGIGKTNPSYKLDVTGDINFTGTLRKNGTEYGGGSSVWSESSNTAVYANNVEIGPSNQEMKIGAIHGGWMGFAHKAMFGENTYAMIQSSGGDTRINIASGKEMGFMENNQWKMHLKGGKLGIGKQNAAYKLDVNGDINLTGSLRINGTAQTFGGGSSVWTEASSEAYYLGNVGIGTDNPGYKLDVRGNMRLGDGSTAEQDILFYSNNGSWQVGTNNAGNGTNNNQFYIYANDTYHFTVQNSTGNVGINKTNPSYRLDVAGDNSIQNTISYSVVTASSVFSDDYRQLYTSQGAVDPSQGFIDAVDRAFALISSVTGINFVKVIETETQVGDIRIGLTDNMRSGVAGFSMVDLYGINDYYRKLYAKCCSFFFMR